MRFSSTSSDDPNGSTGNSQQGENTAADLEPGGGEHDLVGQGVVLIGLPGKLARELRRVVQEADGKRPVGDLLVAGEAYSLPVDVQAFRRVQRP